MIEKTPAEKILVALQNSEVNPKTTYAEKQWELEIAQPKGVLTDWVESLQSKLTELKSILLNPNPELSKLAQLASDIISLEKAIKATPLADATERKIFTAALHIIAGSTLTPLSFQLARILLLYGVNVNVQDHVNTETALKMAIEWFNPANLENLSDVGLREAFIIHLLAQENVFVNVRDNKYEGALHAAVRYPACPMNVITTLLKNKNLNMDLQNSSGETPAGIVSKGQDRRAQEIFAAFKAAGYKSIASLSLRSAKKESERKRFGSLPEVKAASATESSVPKQLLRKLSLFKRKDKNVSDTSTSILIPPAPDLNLNVQSVSAHLPIVESVETPPPNPSPALSPALSPRRARVLPLTEKDLDELPKILDPIEPKKEEVQNEASASVPAPAEESASPKRWNIKGEGPVPNIARQFQSMIDSANKDESSQTQDGSGPSNSATR